MMEEGAMPLVALCETATDGGAVIVKNRPGAEQEQEEDRGGSGGGGVSWSSEQWAPSPAIEWLLRDLVAAPARARPIQWV